MRFFPIENDVECTCIMRYSVEAHYVTHNCTIGPAYRLTSLTCIEIRPPRNFLNFEDRRLSLTALVGNP